MDINILNNFSYGNYDIILYSHDNIIYLSKFEKNIEIETKVLNYIENYISSTISINKLDILICYKSNEIELEDDEINEIRYNFTELYNCYTTYKLTFINCSTLRMRKIININSTNNIIYKYIPNPTNNYNILYICSTNHKNIFIFSLYDQDIDNYILTKKVTSLFNFIKTVSIDYCFSSYSYYLIFSNLKETTIYNYTDYPKINVVHPNSYERILKLVNTEIRKKITINKDILYKAITKYNSDSYYNINNFIDKVFL